MGKHRSYQIWRIDLRKPSFQGLFFLDYISIFSPFHECVWLFLGRKCTHNHHHLALKRQLSPLTVAEIALGYVWALYPIQWLGLSAGGDCRKWVGPNGHAASPCSGIVGLLETRATCPNHSMAKQIKCKEVRPSALVWRLLSLDFDLLRGGTVYTSIRKLKKDTARLQWTVLLC